MSYETVIQKIKDTPAEFLDTIAYYIDFINYKSNLPQESKTAIPKIQELAWWDDRDADEIISDLCSARSENMRFGAGNELFN